MRKPDDCVRLRHMLDAARKAIHYAHGHSLTDMAEDEPLNLILMRLLELVGEAARNVSSETKAQYPQLP